MAQLKKVFMLIGVIVGMLLLWAVLGFIAADQFGKVGSGGALLIGFAAVPVVIRLTVAKLFKGGSKKLEP